MRVCISILWVFFKFKHIGEIMKKVTYIRCPRCELNYIQKKDKFCSVCKQEMQVGGGEFDELDLELCPICKTNYIQPDEVMCATCLNERSQDPNFDKGADDWAAYLNRDEDEEIVDSSDEELGEMATVKVLGDDGDDDLDDDDDDDDFDDLDIGDDMDEEVQDEMFDDDDDDFDDDDDVFDDEDDDDE